MKKLISFLIILFPHFLIAASQNFEEGERLFHKGSYEQATSLLRRVPDDPTVQIHLLAMRDFRDYPGNPELTIRLLASNIQRGDKEALLIQAFAHLDIEGAPEQFMRGETRFPHHYKQIIKNAAGQVISNPGLGTQMLATLAGENYPPALYWLGKYYLHHNRRAEAIPLFEQAMLRGHIKAQQDSIAESIPLVRVKKEEDQCMDHCNIWCLYPGVGCGKNDHCGDSFGRWLGCGNPRNEDPHRQGWVHCNLGLGGCASELTCTSCTTYSTNGFINLLKGVRYPILFVGVVSTFAGTILSAMASQSASSINLSNSTNTVVDNDILERNQSLTLASTVMTALATGCVALGAGLQKIVADKELEDAKRPAVA